MSTTRRPFQQGRRTVACAWLERDHFLQDLEIVLQDGAAGPIHQRAWDLVTLAWGHLRYAHWTDLWEEAASIDTVRERVVALAALLLQVPSRADAMSLVRTQGCGGDDYFHAIDLRRQAFAVHSRQPELEGHNLMDWRAKDGSLPFRDLHERALSGGGLIRYEWQRPSSGVEETKLGYVALVPRWGWAIGSGIYLRSS